MSPEAKQMLKAPPMPQWWTLTVGGDLLPKREDEPFATLTSEFGLEADGPGFLNRGKRQAQSMGQKWDDEAAIMETYNALPPNLRPKIDKPIKVTPLPHGGDAPLSLKGLVAGNPDANEWLKILAKWRTWNAIALVAVAGPAWWYAIHSAASHPETQTKPALWVARWLALFPCPECRKHFQEFLTSNPPPKEWSGMKEWASAAHDWVTANK